jgi:membrane-anchored glycerophosphoryl diester phosphodiesterase (GDPDase)
MSFTSNQNSPREIAPFTLLQEAFSEVGPIYLPLVILMSPTIVLPVLQAVLPSLKSPISLVNAFVLTPLFSGAAIYFVYCYIQRETIDIQGAFARSVSNLGNLMLGMVLSVLAVIAGLIGLVIPGIYIMVQLVFVLYVITIEEESAIDAMKSSWNLVKGRWWPVLGSLLVPALCLTIPMMIVAMIVGFIFGMMFGLNGSATAIALSTLVGAVLGLLITPPLSLYCVKLYLRVKSIATA